MATYHCLKDLEGKELCDDDRIVFVFEGKKWNYVVDHRFCSCRCGNDRVFDLLDLDAERFCSEYYGYQAHAGHWPECNTDDYAALTRVWIALFKLLEPDPIREVCDWIDKVEEARKKHGHVSLS